MKFQSSTLVLFTSILVTMISSTSCNYLTKQDEPTSCFTISSGPVYENIPVQFKNCSRLADYYHWDFGDGTYSSEAEPSHTFKSFAYAQEVRLTAINENGNEHRSMNSFEVREYGPSKIQVNSLTILYESSPNSHVAFDPHDGSGPDFTFQLKESFQLIYKCPYYFDNCQFDTPYTFDSQHGLPFEINLLASTFHLEILDRDENNYYDLVDSMSQYVWVITSQYPNEIITVTGDDVIITMEVSWHF